VPGKLFEMHVFHQPHPMAFLAFLAEWWYNTSYHTSLEMTPFQALYGLKPPMVAEVINVDCPDILA
jgi:hypothetical protein